MMLSGFSTYEGTVFGSFLREHIAKIIVSLAFFLDHFLTHFDLLSILLKGRYKLLKTVYHSLTNQT